MCECGKVGGMEHLVDLDELAARLAVAAEKWRRHARVGPFTWRDERASWPQPILTDRTAIEVPESLGVTLFRGDDEFQAVVWTGGWAGVDLFMHGTNLPLCPEFQDVDGAYSAVVRNAEDFLA